MTDAKAMTTRNLIDSTWTERAIAARNRDGASHRKATKRLREAVLQFEQNKQAATDGSDPKTQEIADGEKRCVQQIWATIGRTNATDAAIAALTCDAKLGTDYTSRLAAAKKRAALTRTVFAERRKAAAHPSEDPLVAGCERAGLTMDRIDLMCRDMERTTRPAYRQWKSNTDGGLMTDHKVDSDALGAKHYANPTTLWTTGPRAASDVYLGGVPRHDIATRFYDGLGMNCRAALNEQPASFLGLSDAQMLDAEPSPAADVQRQLVSLLPAMARRYADGADPLANVCTDPITVGAVQALVAGQIWEPDFIITYGKSESVDLRSISSDLRRASQSCAITRLRWLLTRTAFARAAYAGEADLDERWTDARRTHQMLGHTPEGEWAVWPWLCDEPASAVFALAADVVSTALTRWMRQNGEGTNLVDNLAMGQYIIHSVFRAGNQVDWRTLFRERDRALDLSAYYDVVVG